MTPTGSEIQDDLRRRITAGEFARRETLLPDRPTLALGYGAENSTVHRALHERAAEGLLVLNLQAVP